MTDYKREKSLPSVTEHIETECGTLHLTLGFQDEILREIICVIGKSGVCGNIMLDTIGKLISIILQSEMPRYKIIKKLKKNFEGMNCGTPFTFQDKEYTGCHDYIIKRIVKEIDKQIN